ncbi:MAG: SCO family protein [Candidatus Zixiibacteriota bacterium]
MKKSDTKAPVLLFFLIGAMIILAFLALVVVDFADRSHQRISVLGEVPDFKFTNQYNQSFGRKDLNGKMSVVSFMFTRCKSICPVMSDNIYQLYKFYDHSDKLQFISITVDPANDTVLQLAHYADSLGVNDQRWIFLYANLEKIVDLSENGFMIAADDLPGGHSTRMVLVDQYGRIRSYHNGMDLDDIELLKNEINTLGRELK